MYERFIEKRLRQPNVFYPDDMWKERAPWTEVMLLQVSETLKNKVFGDPEWEDSREEPKRSRGQLEKGFPGCAKKQNFIVKR